MIIAPAAVQPACARVFNGNTRFTFHRISQPILGALPIYRCYKPRKLR